MCYCGQSGDGSQLLAAWPYSHSLDMCTAFLPNAHRFKDPHRSYLSVTQQGGTPNYMAPELFNGTRVDEAADVYSLGCILYECVARKQPFGHLLSQAKSFNVLFKVGCVAPLSDTL